MSLYAQGDVLLIATDQVPPSATEVPTHGIVTVAYGEQSGHHHSIYSDRVRMFREDGSGGGMYIMIGGQETVDLTHQEHDTIIIKPGAYEVRVQRTFHSGTVHRVGD